MTLRDHCAWHSPLLHPPITLWIQHSLIKWTFHTEAVAQLNLESFIGSDSYQLNKALVECRKSISHQQ